MIKKKGQTPKSPAHKKLTSHNLIMALFSRIKNRLFTDPVNLQLLASVVLIVAMVAAIGGAHG